MNVLNFYHIGSVIPENAVYIGRKNAKFGLEESIFKNPFYLKNNEPRGSTIEKYRQHIWKEVLEEIITKQDILSLDGKDIVCYCKPKACHGDVVKALYLYVKNNEQEFDEKIKKYRENKIKKAEDTSSGKPKMNSFNPN